jgi:hypothetical protein
VIGNYDANGLKFAYPENWKVREACAGCPKEIIVESPSGAFLSLHIYPEDSSPAQIVEEAIRSLRDEYEDRGIELRPYSGELVSGGPVAGGYDVSFSLLDFIVHVQLRCFRHDERTILSIWQAEDREFDRLRRVALAMLLSLVSANSVGVQTE